MMEEMQGTPQATHDPRASGLGGTPRGGAGPGFDEVARKSPSRRAAGAGAKQPTKRKSAKQKAKREAAAPAAKKSPRKAAATKNTAAKRASKSGATRRRVHQRH